MYIVIVGNVVDGLSFIGPFDDGEEANEFAEHEFNGLEWISMKLTPTTEF